ncbi:MAG: polysaccharide biosynthesis tyrosine autokinase [Anaeromyxobacter sp.]
MRPEDLRPIPGGRGAEPPRIVPPPPVAEPSPLREWVRVVQGSWLWVACCAALGLAGGAAYLYVKAPEYAANTVIQVEAPTRSLTRLDELSAALGEPPPSDAEKEILTSRTLLEAVVQQLGLEVEARPVRLPLVGDAMARHHAAGGLAEPPFPGVAPWGWGGEAVRVQRLDLSDELIDVPLRLEVGQGGAFRLLGPSGVLVAHAQVGQPFTSGGDPPLAEGFVSELSARRGTAFEVVRRRASAVVEELQQRLVVTERGQKTGILQVELTGRDPVRVAQVLDALAAAYVRSNVERRSAEAAKTLAFLETQLPDLKERLSAAEAEMKGHQQQKGTVDLSSQTQRMLDRQVAVEKDLQDIELQRSELSRKYTSAHPAMAALDEKAQKLRSQQGAIAAQMRNLPETELESARLARDVKVASEMYVLVLNRVQELRVVKSGTVGNVRIIDKAVPPVDPTSPRTLPVLGLALLLGLGSGVAAAFARDALDDSAEDPDELERVTGVPVFASVPHSGRQEVLARHARRGLGLLAVDNPGDPAVESLRSLRTSLQFALVDASGPVISVTGPAPEQGKSFVAANLALVLAAGDRRVVLVDGDMRRGRLHRYFQRDRSPGLSEVLAGELTADEAIRPTGVPRLDLLPTGRVPPNPAELLAGDRFRLLLAELSVRYDLVVVDTPPVLAVTDPALVARAAGVSLLVLRAGRHPAREVEAAVRRLTQNGARVHGLVLNDVRRRGRYGRYAGHYHYEYRSTRSE